MLVQRLSLPPPPPNTTATSGIHTKRPTQTVTYQDASTKPSGEKKSWWDGLFSSSKTSDNTSKKIKDKDENKSSGLDTFMNTTNNVHYGLVVGKTFFGRDFLSSFMPTW